MRDKSEGRSGVSDIAFPPLKSRNPQRTACILLGFRNSPIRSRRCATPRRSGRGHGPTGCAGPRPSPPGKQRLPPKAAAPALRPVFLVFCASASQTALNLVGGLRCPWPGGGNGRQLNGRRRGRNAGDQGLSPPWTALSPVVTATRACSPRGSASRPPASIVNIGAVVVQSIILRSFFRANGDHTSRGHQGGGVVDIPGRSCGARGAGRRRPGGGNFSASGFLQRDAAAPRGPRRRLRLSELARAVHLSRSGVTRLANRLESMRGIASGGTGEDGATPDGSGAGRVEAGESGVRPSRRRNAPEAITGDGEVETLNGVLSRIVTAETGAECQ